jgi:gliding motility-associated-like protein
VNANGTPQTVSPVATTTYTVNVTDGNGCSASAQTTVTVNPLPTPDAGIDQTICSGNAANLLASGGGTYTWNGGSLVNANGAAQTVSPLSTTSYTVTVTNGFGCSLNDTMIVNVNLTPTTSAGPDVTICSGDSTQLSASGAGTFSWSPAAGLSNASIFNPQASPASTTNYIVTLTAANGCSTTDAITVNVNARPTAIASNDTTVCSGTTITLASSGGGTYSWNGGALVNASGASQSVSPAITTSYIVTVTAANGCTDDDTVNVAVNALPNTNAGPDVSICPNSTIQMNASGAASYSWSPAAGLDFTNIPNPNASPTVTTTYIVTGTNAAGCSLNDTVVVTLSNVLSVFAGPDVTICSGDTVMLNTSGGVIYNWTPAASLQTPTSASTNAFPSATTTYTVSVTDANSCSGTDSITVFVNPAVTLSVSGTSPICSGQSSTLTANPTSGTGPFTYNWSNGLTGAGPQTVSPGSTTTYTVSATDSFGCTSQVQNIIVTVNPTPTVALQSSSNVTCFNGTNGTATVLPSGGNPPYTYAWSPSGGNAATANGLNAGSYTVTVTSNDGCVGTQSVTLTQPTAIQLTNASTNENCTSADGTASASASGGTPGYTYLWSNSGTNDTITNLSSGTYTVTATDLNGCTSTSTVVVGNSSSVNADAGVFTTITAGQSTILNATGGTTYSWSPSTDLSCSNCQSPVATPTVTTTYTVTVSDGSGCFATDTVTIFVDVACGDVFVPNAFSPNNDNANDTFYVRGNCIKFMDLQIFNRWGEKVFASTDPAKGWDGVWRGQPCETATFTYYLRATLLDGTEINKQGTISLVK